MDLRTYLRNEWSMYIRPLVVKDKCEFCGDNKELHLHHIDRFHNILLDTLEELDLIEKDTEEYTETELENISNIMLGKQLKCGYKTLCKKCHLKLHAKEVKEEVYKQPLSPYGSYFYINIDKFKQDNVSHSAFMKIIKLGTYMNWNNTIKSYGWEDFCDILGINERTLGRYKKELKKVISINEEGYIYIDENYIKKGYNNYKDRIIVFIDNFNYMYDSINIRQHKVVGDIIYNNYELKQAYFYGYGIKYQGKTKLKECIDSDIIKYKKGEIIFNPKIFLFVYPNEMEKVINDYDMY